MDLIDREQVLKAIDDYTKGKPLYDYPWQIIEVIKSVPSAEKIGRWIFIGEYTCIDGFMNRVWKCNQCGWKVVDDSDYCPNCGVRME